MSEKQLNSLVAAIEGDYSKMSHSDLVLTVKMLHAGRELFREESEKLQRDKEHLEKALGLKLDTMPSGLTAAQSMKRDRDYNIVWDTLKSATAWIRMVGGDCYNLDRVLSEHPRLPSVNP